MKIISFCTLLGVMFSTGAGAAESSFPAASVTGALPYSNQWKYEKPDSLLFALFDPQTLLSTQFQRSDFSVNVSSTSMTLFGLNYLARLGDFYTDESARKSFSYWLRTSLEVGAPSTSVQSDSTPLSSASNTGQIFVGRLGAGPMFSWDLTRLVRPFVAAELWFYAYRHSASINAIDFNGQGWMLEPMIGVESGVIDPIHAILQLGFNRALSRGDSALVASSTSLSFGLGVLF